MGISLASHVHLIRLCFQKARTNYTNQDTELMLALRDKLQKQVASLDDDKWLYEVETDGPTDK